jgi:hypothetical protein
MVYTHAFVSFNYDECQICDLHIRSISNEVVVYFAGDCKDQENGDVWYDLDDR